MWYDKYKEEKELQSTISNISKVFSLYTYEYLYSFEILATQGTKFYLCEYIEIFYNRKRIYTSLGNKSPKEMNIHVHN